MRSFIVTALLLLGVSICSAQSGKIESAGAPDSSVPDKLKASLDSTGSRAILDDGSVACEIWLRKSVPAQSGKGTDDVLYPELAESTLVGVISFPKAATDYRGQAIAAGSYTLRYELIPNDGNHLGVSPNRDFLLLVPVASDPDPEATFKFEELVGLSRKATGTHHPGPLSMVQAPARTAAALHKDDEDHWVFSTAIKLSNGKDLPIAWIVKGTAPQ